MSQLNTTQGSQIQAGKLCLNSKYVKFKVTYYTYVQYSFVVCCLLENVTIQPIPLTLEGTLVVSPQ